MQDLVFQGRNNYCPAGNGGKVFNCPANRYLHGVPLEVTLGLAKDLPGFIVSRMKEPRDLLAGASSDSAFRSFL